MVRLQHAFEHMHMLSPALVNLLAFCLLVAELLRSVFPWIVIHH